MKDAGWRACVVLLWIIHGNVTSQPPWRMSFCILCSNRIMWTWTRSGCGSNPSVTAWATRTLTSVHLSCVILHILYQISANLHLSPYLPIWLVRVIVQAVSKCSLWRTNCDGYLEAGTGSVLVRLSDRYPGKAHLNPRCSGENSLYSSRCTGEMHTPGLNPSALMSGIM